MHQSTGLPVSAFPVQTQLVTMAVVRSLRGITADAIQNEVDAGQLRFVWHVGEKGARAKICSLRFWMREIIAPATVANLSLVAAIAAILGSSRARWRGVEISQMLLVSRPHIHRLNQCNVLPGQIKDRTLWIARPALERFLTDRCQATG